jgi:tetratricopeptide (TPR) repeat protein
MGNKKIIFRFFILLPVLLGFCCSGYGQNLVPELFDQGMRLYAEKDYSGASDYLGQVVDMEPAHDQARYYLVFCLSSTGHNDKALTHAQILTKKYPEQKQYTQLVAQLKKSIAGEKKRKAERKSPRSVPKEVMLGGYKSKDTVYKPKMPEKTRDIKPPRKLTKLEKAIRLIDEDYNASAAIMLDEILASEPKNTKAMHYHGVIKFNEGYFQEAQKWFQKATEIDPKSFQTLFLLGDCYRVYDDYEKAARQFKKAVEVKDDVFAKLNLADCYMKINRIKDAEKIYQKISDKDANIAEAALGMAQIKMLSGYTHEASEMVNNVLVSDPNNAEAHYIKAHILMDGGLYDDAADHVRAAHKLYPDNLKYKSLLALAMIRAFRVAPGLELASSILPVAPDSVDARLAIAEGLILSGAFSDAEEHLQNVESRMKHPETHRLRALWATKTGKTEEAAEHYRSYIALTDGRPRPYMEYAEFLESKQNYADALTAYEEIAGLFKDTAFAKIAKAKIEELREKTAQGGSNKGPSENYRKGKVKF